MSTPKKMLSARLTTKEATLMQELEKLFPGVNHSWLLRRIFQKGAPAVIAERREELKAQRDE